MKIDIKYNYIGNSKLEFKRATWVISSGFNNEYKIIRLNHSREMSEGTWPMYFQPHLQGTDGSGAVNAILIEWVEM